MNTSKLLTVILSASLPLIAAAGNGDISLTLTEAGTLARELDRVDQSRITSLKIAGPLNADDLILLREATGQLASVQTLDLSATTLVAGEECYATLYGGTNASNTYIYYNYYISDTPHIEETVGENSLGAAVLNINHYSADYAGAFCKTGAYHKVVLPQLPSIGENIFSNNTTIEEVIVPEGPRFVGGGAFGGATSMKTLVIPASVDSIGIQAFYSCPATVGLSAAPRHIDEGAFRRCGINSIDLSAIEYLGEYAFDNSKLSGVVDMSKLTAIPAYVAQNTAITEVKFAPGLVSVGEFAFSGCSQLSAVNLPETVAYIGQRSFEGTPWLKNNSHADSYGVVYLGKTAYSSTGDYKDVIIKDGTLALAGEIFRSKRTLTDVTIPSSVSTIGASAFESCSALSSVTWSEGLETIGSRAFANCSSLWLDYIPESLRDIGSEAFTYCTSLTEFTFPENLEAVGGEAFLHCLGISSVFLNSINLKGSLTFESATRMAVGPKVRRIPEIMAAKLRRVTFEERDPDLPLTVSAKAFVISTALEECQLPDNTIEIGESAFARNGVLGIEKFPSKIRIIGDYAFDGNTGRFGFSSLNQLESVGTDAFKGCQGVTDFPVGENLVWLGNGALAGTKIKSIAFHAGFMDGHPATQPFQSGFISDRQSCPDLKTISFAEGVKRIPISLYGTGIEVFNVPDGVESLGGRMPVGIKQVTLPPSCTNFEDIMTFYDLDFDLQWRIDTESISDAPEGEISERWMAYATSSSSLYVPEGVIKLGDRAFNSTELPFLSLPASLAEIHPQAFLDIKTDLIEFRGSVPPVPSDEGGAVRMPSSVRIRVPEGSANAYRSLFGPDANIEQFSSLPMETYVEQTATYHTLQGRQVQPDRLTPGFYIKRVGPDAEKIIIR